MQGIAVLDAGGQYCHLLARRIREFGVQSHIFPIDVDKTALRAIDGIIISGGPSSVLEVGSPRLRSEVLHSGIPILGICYGHQLLANSLPGGVVQRGEAKEYGLASLHLSTPGLNSIFRDIPLDSPVWMSHGDSVVTPPNGFEVLASTDECPVAAMGDPRHRVFGVQFHPEVTHTLFGRLLLRNFVTRVCRASAAWQPSSRETIERLKEEIATRVGPRRRVLFFISGGVDSTVAFKLCLDALGPNRVHGVFVDTGYLRKGEADEAMRLFDQCGFPSVELVNAPAEFLAAVGCEVRPEYKRKAIGRAFLDVESRCLDRFPADDWVLGQGTIYPDTIESGGTQNSALIKTHHNRVPELLKRIENGQVVEPLVLFYKDEVRKIGRALNLPESLVSKEPFPGPGLAVRCICSDANLSWMRNDELSQIAAQYGYVAYQLPIKAVGVQGDERSYAHVGVLQGPLDLECAGEASRAITNSVSDVNRVALWLGGLEEIGNFGIHESYANDIGRLDLLREADSVVRRVLSKSPFASTIWQCPVVLLPLGSDRGWAVAVRPIESHDGMTAQFVKVSAEVLTEMKTSLLGIKRIAAVLYDVTNKPPATIEWE